MSLWWFAVAASVAPLGMAMLLIHATYLGPKAKQPKSGAEAFQGTARSIHLQGQTRPPSIAFRPDAGRITFRPDAGRTFRAALQFDFGLENVEKTAESLEQIRRVLEAIELAERAKSAEASESPREIQSAGLHKWEAWWAGVHEPNPKALPVWEAPQK